MIGGGNAGGGMNNNTNASAGGNQTKGLGGKQGTKKTQQQAPSSTNVDGGVSIQVQDTVGGKSSKSGIDS